jgi:hypothetical protein
VSIGNVEMRGLIQTVNSLSNKNEQPFLAVRDDYFSEEIQKDASRPYVETPPTLPQEHTTAFEVSQE